MTIDDLSRKLNLVDSTVGIIFLGTPHSGTVTFTPRGASAASISAAMVSYPDLRKESQVLADLDSQDGTRLEISQQFLIICHRTPNLELIDFFEQRISNVGKQLTRDNIEVWTLHVLL